MKTLREYLRRLTTSSNAESSKRFMALYLSIFLVTYVVLRFTNVTNVELILCELIAFILTLVGLTSYENHKGINNEKDESDKLENR